MPHPAVLLDPDDPVFRDANSADDGARARLQRTLAWASARGEPTLADPLADLLLGRVLDHEGPFALAAERAGAEEIDSGLLAAAATDLQMLQRAARRLSLTLGRPDTKDDPRSEVKRKIASRADWGDAVTVLAAHLHRYGAGVLGRSRVFRWDGSLLPVAAPDPVTLDDLIGYEEERALLSANLDAFVAGRPANNALLYGDRGTGKSSTVKALGAAFPMDTLRLLEITREQLGGFREIADRLRDRPARFLVLLDDLSFEELDEGGTHIAALKSMLEGGAGIQPRNVLLYVTSNRRHLIREDLADRRGAGEVHVSDTFQEKLSLSDRFGLRVLYLSPDQGSYLRICRGIAERRGLEVGESFDADALLWCRRHNARSCRTARQFVDDYEARREH